MTTRPAGARMSKNGARTKTTVTVGLSSGGTTQITSGLRSGAQVYLDTITTGTRGSTSGGSTQRQEGGFPGGFGGYGGGNFPGSGNFRGGGSGNFTRNGGGFGGNAP